MALASKLEVLTQEKLTRIHEASIKILEETGVIFQSPEVLEIFKKHGAKVNGEIVYIPRNMVEECLETCPESFTWGARNPSNSLHIGKEQKRIAISPNSGTVYIQDIDQGRRLGKTEDFINLAKLCQASNIINTVGTTLMDLGDVDPQDRQLVATYQLLKHTDKPLIGMVSMLQEQEKIFDMLDIAMEHPSIAVSINPSSPLRYGIEQLETILAYASRKQPIFILPCALAGGTGPISLFGTTILQNTEILAGMVLTQLINPGTPVVYSPASSIMNMKRGSYVTGSPEGNLMNISCIQMALNLYNVPTRSMAGLTDAKVVDAQAGYETMQNLFMLMLSGVHIINECLGVLDSIMTTSYEKFLIDEEILSRIMRIMEGMDTSDEKEAVAVIQEVAHSGEYIMHPTTYSKFRERWRPLIADWDTYEEWQDKGSEDVTIRANRKLKEILRISKEALIDPHLDQNLKSYLGKVNKDALKHCL